MYGLYRVATLIFSCTRARIHQFGGPEMFSHKTSQKTANLAIFRLRLKLHQNSKNKRKNSSESNQSETVKMTRICATFTDDLTFTKKRKKTWSLEKFSAKLEHKNLVKIAQILPLRKHQNLCQNCVSFWVEIKVEFNCRCLHHLLSPPLPSFWGFCWALTTEQVAFASV